MILEGSEVAETTEAIIEDMVRVVLIIGMPGEKETGRGQDTKCMMLEL